MASARRAGLAVLLSLTIPASAGAAPLDLDPGFGSGGWATFPSTLGSGHQFNDIVVQPDGRLVLAGTQFNAPGSEAGTETFVARTTAEGALDPGFGGGDGIVMLPGAGTGSHESAAGVAIAPDGTIFVSAEVVDPSGIRFGLYNLTADGVLNSACSHRFVDLSDTDSVGGVAADGDNRLLVTGEAAAGAVAVGRFACPPGGGALTEDPTFGADGGFESFAAGDGRGRDIAWNGSHFFVTTGGTDTSVLRGTGSGVLDPGFGGGDGIATISLSPSGLETPQDLAIDGGRIAVTASRSGGGGDLVGGVFTPAGEPDGAIGTAGRVSLPVTGAASVGTQSVFFRSGGGLILLGIANRGGGELDLAAGATGASGQPDTAVSADGTRTHSLDQQDFVSAAAAAAGGTVVGAGERTGAAEGATAFRLLADATGGPAATTPPGQQNLSIVSLSGPAEVPVNGPEERATMEAVVQNLGEQPSAPNWLQLIVGEQTRHEMFADEPAGAPRWTAPPGSPFDRSYANLPALAPGESTTVRFDVVARSDEFDDGTALLLRIFAPVSAGLPLGTAKVTVALHNQDRIEPGFHIRERDVTFTLSSSRPDSNVSCPRARGSAVAAAKACSLPRRKLKELRGTASGDVRRVEVAILRTTRGVRAAAAKSCSWVTASGRIRKLKATKGRCLTPVLLKARGTRRWRLRLRRTLPRGSYVVYSRAVPRDGVPERGFSARDRNRLQLRLR